MDMESEIQRTLAVIHPCFAFSIPPQTSSSGHSASSWSKEPAWTGRLIVSSTGVNGVIELKDLNGTLFAACPIIKNGPTAVQKVADSSRYFVLRAVDQKSGRHAFIGIAFDNRSDAFDFNVAMEEFQKEAEREKAVAESTSMMQPSKDYALKQNQKISIKLNSTRKPKDSSIEEDSGNGNLIDVSATEGWSSFDSSKPLGQADASKSNSDWETFF